MKAKIVGILLSVCLALWGYLTGGWTHTLTGTGELAMFLALLSVAEAFVITAQAGQVARFREMASPEYERSLQRRESVCDEIEEENRQLQRDLAAAAGRADMAESYLKAFTDKRSRSDAVLVDGVSNKFVSPDGMSREEKDKRAFLLSEDGWDNASIAEELNLSTGGIKSYISRGRKYFRDHPKEIEKDGNEIHLKYEQGA